jgi:hypothetical protein
MKRTMMVGLVVLVMAPLALADAPQVGVVTGVVHDPEGVPMPGATVQLISERGTMSGVSGADGSFRFLFIIPDEYTVRADLDGFQGAEGVIMVTAGGRADLILRLTEVAGEEIVVTAETPLINKFDVTSGGTVDRKELEEIISATRIYTDALDYLPGVDGQQIEANTIHRTAHYVEGVDSSYARYAGGTRLRLPTNAVGQVKVETSGADAQYSRTMGGFTIVTVRSGTNAFHGDVSARFENLAWNEPYDEFPQDLTDDIFTTWEASIGGPILKDKLWFFGAAANQESPGYWVLVSGEKVDRVYTNDPWVGKLDWRPNSQHSLALTLSEAPYEQPFRGARDADLWTLALMQQGGNLGMLRWNWAVNDDWFLESAVASQTSDDTRTALYTREADSSAHPSSPPANPDIVYGDATTVFYRNAMNMALGPGTVEFPRFQGNAAVNWFTNKHDLKLGADYQDTTWKVNTKKNRVAIGRGYDPTLPGGFTRPLYMNVYSGPADVGGVENTSETWAVFARDRFTPNDRWTFNVGLRFDDQAHNNDAGDEVFQFARWSPRFAAVYDVRGDSRLLVTVGAGRYYDWIPMSLTEDFNTVAQGGKHYIRYRWNPATEAYDTFQFERNLLGTIENNTIDLTYKDEFNLGVEWGFHRDWAFRANALYYEQEGQYSDEEQVINEDLDVGAIYENTPSAYVKRTRVYFVVKRRYRNNWMLNASYTWADTQGTCWHQYNLRCADSLGRLRDFTNEDGIPWTVVNRDGTPRNGYPHQFKVRGAYLLPLGRGHSLTLSGFFKYRNGRRWEMIETGVDIHPDPEITETAIVYQEPAGSRHLDDLWQLNGSVKWRFPIVAGLEGSVLFEANNVTNEQVQTGLSNPGRAAGDPSVSTQSAYFQAPRTVRLLVTLSY